jgi:outer membrane protein assembly factor BamE (lipoprotein component of BamABCDE complex)
MSKIQCKFQDKIITTKREGKMKKLVSLLLILTPITTGCMSASQHAAEVQNGLNGDRLTVGTVQREIRVGMSGAQVAEALGSPNIVSTDEKGREVWIYDKIATDHAYSSSSGGISALFLGGAPIGSAIAGGIASGNVNRSAGADSTSQRTLTVIVKFDEQRKVRDFAYHSSRF